MGHTLLRVLELLSLNALLYVHAEANRPKAELSADGRDIPVGGSVTLTCSVKPSSPGWKYTYIRGENYRSNNYSILPGQISVSQEGLYWCRGQREKPRDSKKEYTDYSDPIRLNINVENKAAVTLQPNWSEIFSGETITLRCEIKNGGDTEWEYEWKTASSEKPLKQNEVSIRSASSSHSGNYRCKGRMKNNQSTDWSDPIKLTISSNRPKAELSADDRDIPVGGNVTLTCSVKTSSPGWKYFYYRGEKPSEPLTTQGVSLPTGQFRVSQEGVYWCRGGRGEPVYYTEYSDSVSLNTNAVSRPKGSSVPVGLIVGLVCGIVLLLLLLFLLYRYRPSKNLHFIRQSQSEGTNQGSDMVNQNEAEAAGGSQDVTYSSIELKNTRKKGTRHEPEESSVYSDVKARTAVAGGSQDVTYSSIKLKNIKKKGRRHEPEESSVYSDVKTRTADDNLTYAQVNHHNNGKAKKTKGTPRRAATDEAVYSEVKPGRSLGL